MDLISFLLFYLFIFLRYMRCLPSWASRLSRSTPPLPAAGRFIDVFISFSFFSVLSTFSSFFPSLLQFYVYAFSTVFDLSIPSSNASTLSRSATSLRHLPRCSTLFFFSSPSRKSLSYAERPRNPVAWTWAPPPLVPPRPGRPTPSSAKGGEARKGAVRPTPPKPGKSSGQRLWGRSLGMRSLRRRDVRRPKERPLPL